MGMCGERGNLKMDKTRRELTRSLVSTKTARSILSKNSIQEMKFSRDCKSLEMASQGFRGEHLRAKRQMQKKLERHMQETLDREDIKRLQKFIGDKQDEQEFYNLFSSGKRKSTGSSQLLRGGKSILSLQNRNCTRRASTSLGIRGIKEEEIEGNGEENGLRTTKEESMVAKCSNGRRRRGGLALSEEQILGQQEGEGLDKEVQEEQSLNAWNVQTSSYPIDLYERFNELRAKDDHEITGNVTHDKTLVCGKAEGESTKSNFALAQCSEKSSEVLLEAGAPDCSEINTEMNEEGKAIFSRTEATSVQNKSSNLTISRLSEHLRATSMTGREISGPLHRKLSTTDRQCLLGIPPSVRRRISDASWTSEGGVINDSGSRSRRGSVLQKSNSCPNGLVVPYSEEPFYLVTKRRRSRRMTNWQRNEIDLETLKHLEELHKRACENIDENNNDEEEPAPALSEILPPIILPRIYTQQRAKEMKKEVKIAPKPIPGDRTASRASSHTQIDVNKLTKNLKECRYLRIRNMQATPSKYV